MKRILTTCIAMTCLLLLSGVSASAKRTHSYSYVPNSIKGAWYTYDYNGIGKEYTKIIITSKTAVIRSKSFNEKTYFVPRTKVLGGKSGAVFIPHPNHTGGDTYAVRHLYRLGKYRTVLVCDDSGYNCSLWYRYKLKDDYHGAANGKYGRTLL